MVLRLGSQAGGIEFGPVDLVCPSAAFVKAPIVATAESMRAQCYVHWNTNDAATCLVYNLRKQIAAHPLELGDAGSGHWLAALVLHACKFHAGRLDGSLGKWQQLADRGSQQARRDAWADMKRMQAHARAEIRQAEAMQEHAGYSDHDPAQRAIALFRRLYDEMSARTEGVEIAIHNEAQLKTMEASQLSINESRSAIAGKLPCLVKPCCRNYMANHFFKSPSWPLHSYQSVLLHPCMA